MTVSRVGWHLLWLAIQLVTFVSRRHLESNHTEQPMTSKTVTAVNRSRFLGAVLTFLTSTLLTQADQVAASGGPLPGGWQVTADLYGTPIYGRLDIEQQGQIITGQFYGDKFEGS